MISVPTLLSTLLLLQSPPAATPTPADDKAVSEQRATAAEEAAERAAAAAERAANARIAEAMKQLAQEISRAAPELTPPDPDGKPVAPPSLQPDVWNATVGLGLIFITGNASTVTINGLATAERKSTHWDAGHRHHLARAVRQHARAGKIPHGYLAVRERRGDLLARPPSGLLSSRERPRTRGD